MKPEDQYNDNLEQFFKQHLENHSPELSSDFWEEMEAFIPAKPPFWMLWAGAAKQFLFPIVLLSSLAIVSLFYWKTIQEKESLSVLSVDQQMKIEEMEQQNEVLKDKLQRKVAAISRSILTATATATSISTANSTANSNSTATAISTSNLISTSNSTATATSTSNSISTSISIANSNLISTDKKQPNSIAAHKQNKPKKVSKNHSVSSFTNTTSIKNTNIISFLTPNKTPFITRTNPKNTLSQIAQIKGDFLSKIRFSFEGGTLFFVQKLKTETTTSNGTSFGASLLMNFELNPKWLLQSGFQIKNISSATITRSYNSLPLSIKKKIVLNRCFLESKLGLAFNFLTNSKIPEISRALNVKAAYIDATSSLALAVPFNQNLRLIIEPNIAYSMTPVVGNEKAFSYGLQLGIRYVN